MFMHQENRIHGNTNHTADIPWDIISPLKADDGKKCHRFMVLVKNGQANWLIFKPFNEPFVCNQAIGKHQKMCEKGTFGPVPYIFTQEVWQQHQDGKKMLAKRKRLPANGDAYSHIYTNM